jgi:perosamine synthetase
MSSHQLKSVKRRKGGDEGRKCIPYGRQCIDDADIDAVIEVLRSDWLTTGPKVVEFEEAFAKATEAKEAVAVSSGTAALHSIMFALDIGPGDEVIVPPMTFAATANAVVFQGGTPVFSDVDPETLLIDPNEVRRKITARTKAVIAVDYAGQPCDYEALKEITKQKQIVLIADACHSLGALYRGKNVGTLADLTAFSFHPVKHITTGEGGMITTNNEKLAKRMRMFRHHGIITNCSMREKKGEWFYEMRHLGYNYRITDFQCALGISQLRKLQDWLLRRKEIAEKYNEAFAGLPYIRPLSVRKNVSHAYHLYVVRLVSGRKRMDRSALFRALRNAGIAVNVHYIPVHFHPFYRRHLGTRSGLCPTAEAAYDQIISLPMYPGLTKVEQEHVTNTVKGFLE